MDDDRAAADEAVHRFEDMPECVLRNLPQLLLCTMKCLKDCFDAGGGGIVRDLFPPPLDSSCLWPISP